MTGNQELAAPGGAPAGGVAVTAGTGNSPGAWRARGLRLVSKITLAMLLVIAICAGGVAWLAQHVVLGKFVETEEALVLRNRSVLARVIDSEIAHMQSTNADWAQWDDLYEFALGRNPRFAVEDLGGGRALDRLNIDLIMFVRPDGSVLRRDLRSGIKADPAKIEASITTALDRQGVENIARKPVGGLLDVDGGPIVMAARNIVRTDGSGVPAGLLVMAGQLHARKLSTELSVLPSEVRVHGSKGVPLPPAVHAIAGRLRTATSGSELALREDDMSDFQLFRDINGNAAFLLETRMPRSVVAAGRDATRVLIFISLVGAVVAVLTLILLVRRLVVTPVVRLTNHMLAIRQSGDVGPTPGRDSADEIGALARKFEDLIQARDADRAQLERMAAAVEHAGDSIAIMDREGRILYVNPQYERQTGYRAEDVVGRKPGRSAGQSALYADVWDTVFAGRTWAGPLNSRRRDGSVVEEDVTIAPVKAGDGTVTNFIAVMRDVTARRQTEGEIRKLATAVEYAAEGILVLNMDGVVEYANPAYERQRHLGRGDAVGCRLGQHAPGLDNPMMYRRMWETVKSGAAWTGEINSRLPDGTIVTEEAMVSPVSVDGQAPTSVVILLHDMTGRMQLERQLTQAQKLESVGRLAAGVAHEINTPVQYLGDNICFLRDSFATISNLLEALSRMAHQAGDGPVPGPAVAVALEEAESDYLQVEVPIAIRQSLEGLDRVGEIVRSMKELAHPATEFSPVDLNRVIRSAISIAGGEWKPVAEIATEFDEKMPPVPCLPGAINQVVVNLLVNAAHAVAAASANRAGARGEIRITTRRVAGQAEIAITDNGTGMTAEVRERIFDPFFTTKPVGQGTGQGLAIAHSVVKKHGGSIDVESDPGAGACFTIRLPLRQPSVPARAA